MKRWILIIIVLVSAVQTNAQFSKAQLQATGLTCAMCSNAINKSLQALSFVETVKVDIKNSAFHVAFKDKSDIDIDAIRQAVEDAGFGIGTLKLTGIFEGLKVENDQHTQIGNKNFHFLAVNEQVLQGEKTIQIVDREFLTAKQFRKFSNSTKMKCVETGKAGSCCTGVAANTRMYHVTI
jgi:copper chaperone CopZ